MRDVSLVHFVTGRRSKWRRSLWLQRACSYSSRPVLPTTYREVSMVPQRDAEREWTGGGSLRQWLNSYRSEMSSICFPPLVSCRDTMHARLWLLHRMARVRDGEG